MAAEDGGGGGGGGSSNPITRFFSSLISKEPGGGGGGGSSNPITRFISSMVSKEPEITAEDIRDLKEVSELIGGLGNSPGFRKLSKFFSDLADYERDYLTPSELGICVGTIFFIGEVLTAFYKMYMVLSEKEDRIIREILSGRRGNNGDNSSGNCGNNGENTSGNNGDNSSGNNGDNSSGNHGDNSSGNGGNNGENSSGNGGNNGSSNNTET